eukprot:9562591-Prorocentrum_lima.AAC.1
MAQAILRDTTAADAVWLMRSVGLPTGVTRALDEDLLSAAMDIMRTGDMTVAHRQQVFMAFRDG